LPYSSAAIRELLMSALNDEDILILCYDHFRSVYERFGSGMSRRMKVQLLIEHCEQYMNFSSLLEQIEIISPRQYRKFAPLIQVSTETVPPGNHDSAKPELTDRRANNDPKQALRNTAIFIMSPPVNRQGAKASVLVVEDQPTWRESLRGVLEEEYDVHIAINYQDAVNQLQNGASFHVIIADKRLNDGDIANEDGIRLIKRLRDIEESVNVILLTGYPSYPEATIAYKELKVFHYLEKYPRDREFDHEQFRLIVSNAVEDAQKKREGAFVFMLFPFTENFLAIYGELKDAIEEVFPLSCKKASDFFAPRRLMDDIERGIKMSRLVIADLTGKNPNVFYEVGMCHGIGQTALLLTQGIDDVPPCLRDVRLIVYENSRLGVARLIGEVQSALRGVSEHERPVRVFRMSSRKPSSYLCLALVPPTPQGQKVYEGVIKPAAIDFGLECRNAQDLFTTGRTMEEIWESINQARVIIADLSGKDPNVFYEIGIGHVLKKKVILMARSLADVPFDLKGRSCVEFSDNTFVEEKKASECLKARIEIVLRRKSRRDANISGVTTRGAV
jgi:CheY-like chemotaxis protein